MGVLQGYKGKVVYGGSVIAVASKWDATIDLDLHDVSVLQKGWKEFLQGQGQVTGSVEGAFDPTDTGLAAVKNAFDADFPGAKVFLELEHDTGYKLSMSAFARNLKLGADIGDAQRFSFDFQSTGTVDISWS